MRSLPLKAATTVILLAGLWACGDDNGGGIGPGNTAPVAAFNAPACTVGTACPFADASTDANGVADITTRLWEFGDGGTSPDQNPTHTYTAAGDYQVKLTVTDAAGASSNVTHTVTASAGTGNTPPTASFVVPTDCTVNSACPFGDTSTDVPPGSVVAWAWNFGDGTPVDPNQNTNHTFGAPGTYQVQLTVTDDQGATNSITQAVTIGATSASQCTTVSTTEVDCALTITSRSSITLTLTAVECELGGNLVLIPPPNTDVAQNVFGNACAGPVGAQYTLKNDAGATLVLEPGFVLHVRLRRGTTDAPAPGSPAGEITGTFPTWTLNFDDGGNPGGLGEPDFGDVVVTVQANPA
jgi:PKD repeat protein